MIRLPRGRWRVHLHRRRGTRGKSDQHKRKRHESDNRWSLQHGIPSENRLYDCMGLPLFATRFEEISTSLDPCSCRRFRGNSPCKVLSEHSCSKTQPVTAASLGDALCFASFRKQLGAPKSGVVGSARSEIEGSVHLAALLGGFRGLNNLGVHVKSPLMQRCNPQSPVCQAQNTHKPVC